MLTGSCDFLDEKLDGGMDSGIMGDGLLVMGSWVEFLPDSFSWRVDNRGPTEVHVPGYLMT
jgi:hypothetical protein